MDVVMISRAGRASLTDHGLARIESVARLRAVQRGSAPSPEEAKDLLHDATVLAATNICLPRLDADLFDACPRLRAVVIYATGYEHVDPDLLASRGVELHTLPCYATVAVAEHALTLVMTQATRAVLANDRSRGSAPADVSLRGVELAGRTLGILGTGRIGSRLGVIASGIGMRVVGTDIDEQASRRARALGIAPVDLDRLVRESDVIAVCASTTPGAPPLLGPDEIAAMRPGAFLVNVGRPPLVDTGAAICALRSQGLRGYAVDEIVADPAEHADVVAEGRLLQTAHSAWWRDEVLERGSQMFGEAVLEALGHATDAANSSVAS